MGSRGIVQRAVRPRGVCRWSRRSRRLPSRDAGTSPTWR